MQEPITTAIWGMPWALSRAWLKKIRPKLLAVGKHLVLAWQVGAAGIHQVEAGQAILLGDGLGAQVFLHRQWIVAAALHRGVVGHDHALHALDAPDAGDESGGRHLFAIDLMGGQLADLQEG
ncbi:hypothetical protein Q3H58_001808 [Pseudomonas psychrotolerans]|nr:hypothetical protein [Pseudomonas psychrotolerans]